MKRILPMLLALILIIPGTIALADDDYKDFREWRHTKSMVIPDKSHGLYGFHNIYANEKAFKGLKNGKYKEEAIFVVRFYEVVDKDGMITQGNILMDAVMVKDDDAKETGGWKYSAYAPGGKEKEIDPVKDCYECHAGGAKEADYIFHKYVD